MIWKLVVACVALGRIALGQGVFFDFRDVPAGPLPGGFLTLERNGVTVGFSANGTTISQGDGQKVLHTASFAGQIGVQCNVAASEVVFNFDPRVPGGTHTMRIAGRYDRNYSIIAFANGPVTSADRYSYRPGVPVWGVLIENVANGFALSGITVIPVPEPGVGMVVFVGAVVVMGWRRKCEERRMKEGRMADGAMGRA